MTVTLQPAFVLHSRSYRETSLIVELFSSEHGRVAAVARGVRKARSRGAALLQAFTPLWVSWYGKGELVTLTQIEPNGFVRSLSGKNLRCGFYMNELLMRLLPKHDPHPQLFAAYQQTLEELNKPALEAEVAHEKALRLFEKKLLMEIGYGLPLKEEQKFNDQATYRFDVEHGFVPCLAQEAQAGIFAGQTLNALLDENFEQAQILQEIKRLMRYVLASLLGRPLESRRLFE